MNFECNFYAILFGKMRSGRRSEILFGKIRAGGVNRPRVDGSHKRTEEGGTK